MQEGMAKGCPSKCPRAAYIKGVCKLHYERKRRAGLGPCCVPSCSKRVHCSGMCSAHNARKQRGLALSPPIRTQAKAAGTICLATPCTHEATARGLCKTHYNRQYMGRYQSMEEHRQKRSAMLRASKYGITEKEYQTLLEEQGGLCAICKEEQKLAVDHCHITQKVRGLLCHACNVALGFFKDDPVRVDAAVVYLRG